MTDKLKVNYRVDKVIKNIQRMVELSSDLRPVLLQIQGESLSTNPNTIIGGIMTQFLRQGSFFGAQWKALSPDYAWKKAKRYGGQSILRASDKMFKAVTVQNAVGNVQILDWTHLIWGLSDAEVPYAKYHQSDAPRKKLPRRAFMGITENQRTMWTKLIAAYITEASQT
jgi:hypothetical protein